MFKKTKQKSTTLTIINVILIFILFLQLFCVLQGCVPGGIKTEVQGVRNDVGRLEKVVEQKADNTVVAGQVEEINSRIEQTAQIAEELSLWRKSIQAETINYGGAVWVVIGTSVMALIFVSGGLLFIRAFMRRGTSLTMLTSAVKKAGEFSPHITSHIKDQLKRGVDDGYFHERDRKNLGNFAKKVGTFVEQK